MFCQSPETYQTGFGKGQKAFNIVDLCVLVCKFVVAMPKAKMFLIAKTHKAIIARQPSEWISTLAKPLF